MAGFSAFYLINPDKKDGITKAFNGIKLIFLRLQ
jgi:hypothetical protein